MSVTDWYNDDERSAMVKAIQHHLIAHGIARKSLVSSNLSFSAINKAMTGNFSEATLTKIETKLGKTFRPGPKFSEQAPADFGGYTFKQVERLQGDYLCLRQLFGDPSVISAYIVEIRWEPSQPSLVFSERSRVDGRFEQSGHVYMPVSLPFINLTTTVNGSVRNILLSLPDEDEICRGVILGLHRGAGNIRLPAVAPVILSRILTDATSELGLIDNSRSSFAQYADLLSSVVPDQYAIIISGPIPADRRRNISVVGGASAE